MKWRSLYKPPSSHPLQRLQWVDLLCLLDGGAYPVPKTTPKIISPWLAITPLVGHNRLPPFLFIYYFSWSLHLQLPRPSHFAVSCCVSIYCSSSYFLSSYCLSCYSPSSYRASIYAPLQAPPFHYNTLRLVAVNLQFFKSETWLYHCLAMPLLGPVTTYWSSVLVKCPWRAPQWHLTRGRDRSTSTKVMMVSPTSAGRIVAMVSNPLYRLNT